MDESKAESQDTKKNERTRKIIIGILVIIVGYFSFIFVFQELFQTLSIIQNENSTLFPIMVLLFIIVAGLWLLIPSLVLTVLSEKFLGQSGAEREEIKAQAADLKRWRIGLLQQIDEYSLKSLDEYWEISIYVGIAILATFAFSTISSSLLVGWAQMVISLFSGDHTKLLKRNTVLISDFSQLLLLHNSL